MFNVSVIDDNNIENVGNGFVIPVPPDENIGLYVNE